VVMESQASGLPVIVTNQGGPKEIVDDQTTDSPTAFVLDPDDRSGWIETMVELSINDDRRIAMGNAGVQAMKAYTFDESFKHYWRVHESVRVK
jgi:glycosyltransferase involved in cell wall biosynthesis